MLTLVKPTAVQVQVKRGNLVRLGKCVSGVLGQDPLYRHLALATEPALEKLERDQVLRQGLLDGLAEKGQIEFPLLTRAGFENFSYNGRSFGIFRAKPPIDFGFTEDRDYVTAENMMMGPESGEHRLIFLGSWGVSAPPAIASLPTHLYSALIARMARVAQDPTFSRTSKLELTQAPLDQIKLNNDRTQTYVVSLPQLEKESVFGRLEIGGVKIELGSGTRITPPARGWDRFFAWLKEIF